MTTGYFVSQADVPKIKPGTPAVPEKEDPPPQPTEHRERGKIYDLDKRPGFFDGTGGANW